MTPEPIDHDPTKGEPSHPITGGSRATARDGLLHSRMDQNAVVFDPSNGTYYTLNEVGGFVLDLVRTPTSIDEIVSEVTRRFDVTAEDCRADIVGLLGQLRELGLVRLEPPSPSGDDSGC